jgi:two-component system sensor histidine kinase TctE
VTVRVSGPDKEVVLEVEDNGPGIRPELREAVLKRFRRGGNEAPGTGLGLPIVDEIAALYGGTMRLEDGEGGRGLKVAVRFPAG